MTLRRVNTGLFDCTGVEGVPDWRAFVPARQSDGAVGYDVRACRVLDKDSGRSSGTSLTLSSQEVLPFSASA